MSYVITIDVQAIVQQYRWMKLVEDCNSVLKYARVSENMETT